MTLEPRGGCHLPYPERAAKGTGADGSRFLVPVTNN